MQHERCEHLLGNGLPCYSSLWEFAGFKSHITRFVKYSQEARTCIVYERLQSMYYAERHDDGECAEPKWHWFVNGRSVCRHVFLLSYPIGSSTLYGLQARWKAGHLFAHAKHEELSGGTASTSTSDAPRRLDFGRLSVIGWYLGYADTVGDYMPDEQQTIVPRRLREEEYDEYAAALGPDAVKPRYFNTVVRSADELSNICWARKLLNFQNCTKCTDGNEEVAQALKSRDPARIAKAKRRRALHHGEQRGERLCYYSRRERGRSGANCISFILDKWDSDKTTCPWFVVPPGAWWTGLKHNVLEQHVLGILVHGLPNESYLYTVNSTIGGGANLNIEGIRRMLLHKFESVPMPETMYVQADNASDNKCWALILFFGMLIFHGYTQEVFFSFLLVGHTHEDIDQLFSVLSRFFKRFGNQSSIMTPQQFQEEMRLAMSGRPAVIETIDMVLGWDELLRPSLVHPAPVGIQHANLKEETLVPHTFWIHRRPDGEVVFHYKELSADKVWLPPQDPNSNVWVTDPDGIQLFGQAPPDPMVSPPKAVELCSVCTPE